MLLLRLNYDLYYFQIDKLLGNFNVSYRNRRYTSGNNN